MDSHWFNQATRMNDYNLYNAGNKIDLTLKLGLPNSDKDPSHLDLVPMTSLHANPSNLDGSYTQFMQGQNQYEMANGVNANVNANAGQSFNGGETAWSSKLGSHSHAQYMQQQQQPSGYGFAPFSASSSMVSPVPMYSNNPYNTFNMNPNPNPNYLLAPRPTMNDYTLLDVPARRAERELGSSSSSSSRKKGTRKQRGGSFIDQYKRCTNYNCNTNDTPMWRKGPLGPKTLCNACGIKYRKEEEKRRAKEAADKSPESHREIG